MEPSTGVKPNAELKPRRFRFFISYAREDYNIAIAVSNAIQTATGPSAEVFMDVALPFGVSFQEEIRKRLDETNVLVAVHSPILKPAFGYTGLELGYFIRVIESETRPDFPRLIVPIYLEKPPDAVAEREGINIGISRFTLNMTVEAYKTTLDNIDYDHSAVKFLRQFQELIDSIREKHGAPKIRQSEDQRDLPGLVMKMQFAIFSHLKTTLDPESTLKPQLQITLTTSDDALRGACDSQLPDDALLIPVGTGKPMAIFGLPSVETTWGTFQQQTKQNKFRDSWIDAITKVVTFSMQNQLAVDNSQVIVSYDEKCAYRVILTTGTRYFNGDREFNLYFVEYLRGGDFGDHNTTLLFKGLELLCRFRSLFLEQRSEFSSMGGRVARAEAIKEFAGSMERELNLLRRDALEAGLDNPSVWLGLIDPNLLLKLSKAWRPLESRIRDALTTIRHSEPGTVESYRESLITTLTELEATMRPLNADVIAEMADKLKKASPSAC
jgi:TIR domain